MSDTFLTKLLPEIYKRVHEWERDNPPTNYNNMESLDTMTIHAGETANRYFIEVKVLAYKDAELPNDWKEMLGLDASL